MDNPIDILNSYISDQNKSSFADAIIACRMLNGPINDKIIIKLKRTLENMSIGEWGQCAPALINIFKRTDSEELKIDCFESIISYEIAIGNFADAQFMGWDRNAKITAIEYLSEINNNRALEAIAKGLKYNIVKDYAVDVLQNNEYGMKLLVEYIRTEENPCRASIRALLGNESDSVVEMFLKILEDKNTEFVDILAEHKNETVKNKALEILEYKKMKRNNELNADKLEHCINNDDVEIINYQTESKGRKKHKYLQRTIRQNPDNSAYFKCPFCNNTNTINDDHCRHVVYAYETVNNLVISENDLFIHSILKSISADPSKYVEDFDYFLEEYLGDQEYEDNQKIIIDIDELKEILEDKITPDVIDTVFNINGIPNTMKSIIIYSLVDDYIGGGTYYYIVSDTDLEKLYLTESMTESQTVNPERI